MLPYRDWPTANQHHQTIFTVGNDRVQNSHGLFERAAIFLPHLKAHLAQASGVRGNQ